MYGIEALGEEETQVKTWGHIPSLWQTWQKISRLSVAVSDERYKFITSHLSSSWLFALSAACHFFPSISPVSTHPCLCSVQCHVYVHMVVCGGESVLCLHNSGLHIGLVGACTTLWGGGLSSPFLYRQGPNSAWSSRLGRNACYAWEQLKQFLIKSKNSPASNRKFLKSYL